MLEKWEVDTRKEENGKYIIEDISKEIKDKMKAKGIHKNDVVGVGIGVPGPVSNDGTVLKCVNLGWGIFNVEETLSEMIDLPVKAEMMLMLQLLVKCGKVEEKVIKM